MWETIKRLNKKVDFIILTALGLNISMGYLWITSYLRPDLIPDGLEQSLKYVVDHFGALFAARNLKGIFKEEIYNFTSNHYKNNNMSSKLQFNTIAMFIFNFQIGMMLNIPIELGYQAVIKEFYEPAKLITSLLIIAFALAMIRYQVITGNKDPEINFVANLLGLIVGAMICSVFAMKCQISL